jgi:predicted glycoside hydrolase/deacetylase ChbG (UPF0249 family)
MFVIINADDLGMSRDVNEAIIEQIKNGRVSSSTVMANGPEVAHAATALKRVRRCSFGAHLNLTQFEPLCGGPGARLLTAGTGQLSRWAVAPFPTPGRLQAMYDELCAQVDRLRELGVDVSHFDSHHHVHTNPSVFPVLKAVQRRYGVRKVRLSKNVYSTSQHHPLSLKLKKQVYNRALRRVWRTTTTDAFTEFLTFTELDPSSLRCRSIELMVHPGAPTAGLEAGLLASDWIESHPTGLTLISYRDL